MSEETPDLDVMQMFDRSYLIAADLGGKERILTVSRVAAGELQNKAGKTKKPIVYFTERPDLPLALNKTNTKTIVKLLGPRVRDWVGQALVLYATTTDMAGETVACIRVKPVRPAPAVKSA